MTLTEQQLEELANDPAALIERLGNALLEAHTYLHELGAVPDPRTPEEIEYAQDAVDAFLAR